VATIRKLTVVQKRAMIDRFADALAADPTPENSRQLAVYREIKRLERTTTDEQLAFLGCQRLRVMRRCPKGDYTQFIRMKFCRKRFYCIDCCGWRLGRQAFEWESLIRGAMASTSLHLGPMLELEWPVPEASARDRQIMEKFSRYIKQTWRAQLASQGIEPDRCMLLRAFDPIRGQIRGLYLGPPVAEGSFSTDVSKGTEGGFSTLVSIKTIYIETSVLKPPPVRNKCTKTLDPPLETSVLKPQGGIGGRPSPWQPSVVRSVYLLGKRVSPVAEAGIVFDRIRSSLNWVLGSSRDILDLTPQRAYAIESLYGGRRLTAASGALYAPSKTTSEPEPSLLIEREHSDGEVEPETRDGLALAGSSQEMVAMPKEPESNQCPNCKTRLEDICEAGDRTNPPPVTVQ